LLQQRLVVKAINSIIDPNGGKEMKKCTVVLVAALILGLASVTHAKYETGYKIVEVADNQVTIRKGNSEPIEVMVKKNGYEVGDEVKYDAGKQKIRRSDSRKELAGC